MTTFNLTSYCDVRVIKTVKAETMQQAQNELESKDRPTWTTLQTLKIFLFINHKLTVS